MTHKKNYAPGTPGTKAKWTSSSKSGVGKALDADSLVAFTISHGILNEIYFPREDIACIRDMEFLVTDGDNFFSEEKRDTTHSIKRIETGVPAYQVINTCVDKKYEIIKEIVTDPYRNTVLQNVSFKNNGQKPLHLCALITPHLNNKGNNNSCWVDEYKGIPMLFAKNEGIFIAVACSSKWLKRSAGFVGVSDGWHDLHQHKKMEWEYTHADNGNIALTGEIDISTNENFVLAISFGRNADDAAGHAWASILDGFESAKKVYIEKWQHWLKELQDVKGKIFQASAGVLRMHEAKAFPGGVIASLSIPWGETKGDDDKGGYHLVWPRDLVEAAGGFLALKTKKDALRILNYLMSMQKADGSWPQNMWLEGTPYWKGVQMDQTALPIVLMSKCNINDVIDKERMERYWPIIKKAIKFLIINGPYTKQDRWEEEKGFTSFTLAAEVAALLAGADLAEQNDEKELAAYCRETADNWNAQIENWTYVTDTSLTKKYNVDGYYIRINPYHDIPAEELGDKTMDLKNHKDGEGKILINELVSADALALVRFGLRAADDPKILNTIKVIDALLKVDTPNGACWHRYNNDGYGEDKEGNPYNVEGIGRAWPLLTGERAHYEIAAGNLEEAKKLLEAMEAFSNNELISEQIWDTDDIPEKELFFGQHSGSAMPLTWAHAEYIKLSASINDNRVFDMPKQTYERYIKQKATSSICVWRFDKKCKSIPAKKILRIEVMADAAVKWTDNNWETTNSIDTTDTGIEIFYADIVMKDPAVNKIEFTFYWKGTNSWEDKNFSVQVGS
jgi:glucoamylase